MRQILLIVVSLISITVSAQTITRYWEDLSGRTEKGFSHKNYYDLKGNVKEAWVSTTWFTKTDSIKKKITFKEKLLFNKYGYIKTKHILEKDGNLFLEEENEYKNNQLVYKKEIEKEFGKLGDGMVGYTGNIHIQETKYVFNENNKHILTYFKSSYQDEFFLKERHTYNSKGLLIKLESINNHLPEDSYFFRTCHGTGNGLADYITKYYYNEEDLRVKVEKYRDTSLTYKKQKIKGKDVNIRLVRRDDIDYSAGYKLESESIIIYNSKKLQDSIIKTSFMYPNGQSFVAKTAFLYNSKGKIIQTKRMNRYGRFYGNYKELGLINGKNMIITSGYLKGDKNKLEKRLNYTIEGLKNGGFKRLNYNKGELESTEVYDSNFNLVEDDGFGYRIVYKYDINNNWIKKTVFHKGKLVEDVERTITYY